MLQPASTTSRARRMRCRRTSWSTPTATMIAAPVTKMRPLGVDAQEQDAALDGLDDDGAEDGAQDGARAHRTAACRR